MPCPNDHRCLECGKAKFREPDKNGKPGACLLDCEEKETQASMFRYHSDEQTGERIKKYLIEFASW